MLIAGLQEIEDEKSKKLKEICELEARMTERDLCKARMVKQYGEKLETMPTMKQKKRKLEYFISTKLTKT